MLKEKYLKMWENLDCIVDIALYNKMGVSKKQLLPFLKSLEDEDISLFGQVIGYYFPPEYSVQFSENHHLFCDNNDFAKEFRCVYNVKPYSSPVEESLRHFLRMDLDDYLDAHSDLTFKQFVKLNSDSFEELKQLRLDYLVVVYKILSYLYEKKQSEDAVDLNALSHTQLDFYEDDLSYTVEQMDYAQYIKGVEYRTDPDPSIAKREDFKLYAHLKDDLTITDKGIEFLHNHPDMAKAKAFLEETK